MGQSSSKKKTRKEKQTLRVPAYAGSFGRGYKLKSEYGVLNIPADRGGVRNKFHSAPRLRRKSDESSSKAVIVYSSSDTGQHIAKVQHPQHQRAPVQNVFERRLENGNVIMYSPNSNGHPVGTVKHRLPTTTSEHEVFEGRSQYDNLQPGATPVIYQPQQHPQPHSYPHQHPHPYPHPQTINSRRTYNQMTVGELKSRKTASTAQGHKNIANGKVVFKQTYVEKVPKKSPNIHRHVPRTAMISATAPNRPPFVPPWRTKQDLIPDPRKFEAINTHAVKCPSSACSSLRSLATYLTKTSKDDLQRIRAIYWWIICNIRYDMTAVLSNTYRRMPCDPKTVLHTRKAVCHGFTNLFAALCREVDLMVKIVTGFSKDFFYNADDPFLSYEDVNHAWNLVYVQGEWRPVDCTWASGYINDSSQFCIGPNDFYFLTDPEKFIWSHFPFLKEGLEVSLQYQLLAHPMSLEEFNRRNFPSQPGYHWGLKLLSHEETIIQVDQQVRIEFCLSKAKLLNLICNMKNTRTGESCDRYIVGRRRKDGSFSVTVYPPEEGRYKLRLYGEPSGENPFLQLALVTYSLHCYSAIPRMQPYPKNEGLWGVKVEAEKYGFVKDVYNDDFFVTEIGIVEFTVGMVRNVTTMFKLQHSMLDIPNLNDYVITEYSYSGMKVKVRLPKAGYYKLSLLAQPPGSEDKTVHLLADYLLQCKQAFPNMTPFPKSFPFTQKCMSVLMEPDSGWLPANQSTTFKIKCADLKRVLVDGKGAPPSSPGVFTGVIQAKPSGETVSIYGNCTGGVDHDELYRFLVVDARAGAIVQQPNPRDSYGHYSSQEMKSSSEFCFV